MSIAEGALARLSISEGQRRARRKFAPKQRTSQATGDGLTIAGASARGTIAWPDQREI